MEDWIVPAGAVVLLAVFGPRLVWALWSSWREIRAERKEADRAQTSDPRDG